MSDPIEPAFQELQREYLSSMPARLDELRSDVAEFREGHRNAADSLKTRLHRLAGSGGSYGFLERQLDCPGSRALALSQPAHQVTPSSWRRSWTAWRERSAWPRPKLPRPVRHRRLARPRAHW